MFVGIFAWNDIKTDNGYRKIFEQEIGDNEYFCIYRTPDKGALGGDYRAYTIDNKLALGFIRRRQLRPNEYEVHQNIPKDINTIIYQNDTITYSNKELKGKGQLK
jgi:hypothetical protein